MCVWGWVCVGVCARVCARDVHIIIYQSSYENLRCKLYHEETLSTLGFKLKMCICLLNGSTCKLAI